MKSAWVVAVLVCVVLAGSAWAQLPVAFSPRGMAMGGAGVAVADDSSAWFQNPAGLAALNLSCREGKSWANDVSASYISFGGVDSTPFDSFDAFRASWSGFMPEKGVGVGAGYANVDDLGTLVGAGVGTKIGNTGLSLGLNITNLDPAFVGVPDETLLNLGAMYLINQGADKAPIRVGVTVNNVTAEDLFGVPWDPVFVNFGVAWPITNDLLIAVDLTDLTEELNDLIPIMPGMQVNGGIEYRFGSNREWAIRGGIINLPVPTVDTQFSAGVGYSFGRYHVDAAWVSPIESSALPPIIDFNPTWSVGAGMSF